LFELQFKVQPFVLRMKNNLAEREKVRFRWSIRV